MRPGSRTYDPAFGNWTKHLVSLADIIDDLDRGVLPSPAMLNEKVRDAVNYPILLEGLIAETRAEQGGVK